MSLDSAIPCTVWEASIAQSSVYSKVLLLTDYRSVVSVCVYRTERQTWQKSHQHPPPPRRPRHPRRRQQPSPRKREPSVGELIVKAVSASKERSGVSLAALKKSLAAGGYDVEKNNSRVKIAVKSLVTKAPWSRLRAPVLPAPSSSTRRPSRQRSPPRKPQPPKLRRWPPRSPPPPKKPKKVAAKKAVAAKKSPKKAKKPATPKKAAKSPKKVKKPAAAAKKAARAPRRLPRQRSPKPPSPRRPKAKKAAPKKK
ncbi:histone H1-like [Oncorhynchus mykiss]|uniref:histone H1-like n=1 Tax=Oncorhynchus mykiss TaxID=8022 RepID=UPI0018780509|nr:histone H1-like [Oncorhynchus mykiss]